MTTKEMIAALQAQGYEVKYVIRKDGGARITRIGNQRYTGSKGNAAAREMLGQELSARRTAQLGKIKSKKGQWGHRKRVEPLEDETIKRIRRVQRLMRKNKINRTGIVTQKNYRYVMNKYGKEEADRRLRQAEKYARGIAYAENVETLAQRLEHDNEKLHSDSITRDIELLRMHLEDTKETDLKDLIAQTYEVEKAKTKIDRDTQIARLLSLALHIYSKPKK